MDTNTHITDVPNAMEKITLYQMLIWNKDEEIRMQNKIRMKKKSYSRQRKLTTKTKEEKYIKIDINKKGGRQRDRYLRKNVK